jgi:hypothetical protein
MVNRCLRGLALGIIGREVLARRGNVGDKRQPTRDTIRDVCMYTSVQSRFSSVT